MESPRLLAPSLVVVLSLALGGCALFHMPDEGPDAAGPDDAGPDDAGPALVCPSVGIATRFVSTWGSPEDSLATAEGDGFYTLDYLDGAHVVRRLDPSGGWSVAATLPMEDHLPGARLMNRDGAPWLARWNNEHLVVGPADVAGADFEPAWDVPLPSSVYTVGALDADRFVALSDSGGEPLSFEIFGADGRLIQPRTPLSVDGGGRLAEGPAGRLAVALENETGLFAGDAGDAPGPIASLGARCPAPWRCTWDIVPLEGAGAFAWAWASDTMAWVEVRSPAPHRLVLSPTPRITALALGAGPNDTLLLTVSRQGPQLDLLLLDAATLAEVASGTLEGDAEPIVPGSESLPDSAEIVDVSAVSVDGIFAVRVRAEIPDGHVGRWALAEICAP